MDAAGQGNWIHGSNLMVISTNLSAQMAATQLDQSSQRLYQSLAELSSGSKITSPSDDSAGLAVSMNFTAQIDDSGAAVNNLNDAISFSQTQDGYLQQVTSALDRMGELAVQAQDVTKNSSDLALYNNEFQTLATYVNSVGNQSFNGISLFSGNAMNVTTDGEGGTTQMQGISGDFLPASTSTTTTEGDPANTKFTQIISGTAGNTSLAFSADGSNGPDYVPFDANATIQEFVGFLNSDNPDTSATYDASTGQLSVTVAPGASLSDSSSIPLFQDLGLPSTINNTSGNPETFTATLGQSVTTTTSNTLDISTPQDAAAALTAIQSAIAQVASDRAQVGTNMEQMNFRSLELETLQQNLSAANSSIMDVDVAQASTNYAQDNILVQAGTAMLAQANALPQLALKLIT
jgi:flagellin